MNKLFLIVVLIVTILLIASCGGTTESTTTPTSTMTTTATPTQTTSTTSTATTLDPSLGAPTAQELTEQDFISPELPRITAERLKQFMDNDIPLVVVDTRIGFLFNMGHLPQSIDIPFQPEDEQATSLLMLPKDRLIVFYCD